MFIDHVIIPVVMFHSVGLENTDWVFSHISEPLKTFEEKIVSLVSSDYHFIFWDELYDHMAGVKQVPRKSIMLTFDDGYLDNWVYVFPILKKYNAKATIFINPEFIDPSDEVRPNLEDMRSGKIKEHDLKPMGFLNWEEMRLMEKSGLVDIQSHALTHTWYFSGPKLIDFHKPGDKKYPWLAWNLRPEQKPFYIQNGQSEIIPLGMPIYEYEKAMICKKYFPPEKVVKGITMLVEQRGGKDFFHQPHWKEELRKHHDKLMEKYKDEGYYETSVEYKKRVLKELQGSKEIIEKNLNKQVDFICWPGGGYNQEILSLAKEVGYKAWTLSSRDQSNYRNRLGADPTQIKRIGSFSKYRTQSGKEYGYAGRYYFIAGIRRHKGSFFFKWFGRILLVFAIVKSMFIWRKS